MYSNKFYAFSDNNRYKFSQWIYVSNTWKRRLGFLLEESIFAKNQITEVLKNPVDQNVVAELEKFQAIFIDKDEIIYVLKNNIAACEKMLLKETPDYLKNNEAINIVIYNLQEHVQSIDHSFHICMKEFIKYQVENLI